jgi:hypothetical protein
VSIEVLTLADKEAWDAGLGRMPAIDVYHLPCYLSSHAAMENGLRWHFGGHADEYRQFLWIGFSGGVP